MSLDAAAYFYEPGKGHGLPHDPMAAIVAPRPIGWISTHDGAGRCNLAPYSFFNIFNYKPPILGFASAGRKDTLRNVEKTREFVWNLVTRSLAEPMNATSATVGADVDEFELAGVTTAPSRSVEAPRVAESPVNLECRLTQVERLSDAAGADLSTWLILGEVVGVHIARHLLDAGIYVTAAAVPVMRGGGRTDYFEVGSSALFRMTQPG
ncbi:MAG TPA: flavin reductase family protein [Steroidobacteraceae bacterium]|nr:flavin reductase family protein [Steroidobacteraceae bacterium]